MNAPIAPSAPNVASTMEADVDLTVGGNLFAVEPRFRPIRNPLTNIAKSTTRKQVNSTALEEIMLASLYEKCAHNPRRVKRHGDEGIGPRGDVGHVALWLYGSLPHRGQTNTDSNTSAGSFAARRRSNCGV
jgi:hypothetical protein